MKVTAKKPCVSGEYKVVEETERFYIVYGDTIGGYTALPKCDYEPVQEWVDVSKDCKYELVDSRNNYYALCHGNNIVGSQYQTHKYRITSVGDGSIKVEVKR